MGKNKTKKALLSLTAVALSLVFAYSFFVSFAYADFSVVEGEKYSLPGIFGTKLYINDENVEVINDKTAEVLKKNGKKEQKGPGNTYEKQVLNVETKLFGVIPLKTFHVNIYPELKLIPSGQAIGVKMFTDGVMVVGMNEFKTESGNKNPAYDAGLRIGDIIIEINSVKQKSIEQTSETLAENGQKTVTFKIRRGGALLEFSVEPVKAADDGKYKIGIWIRDSTAGIGTLTFVEEQSGVFASLGHGICDTDTGDMMPIADGSIHHTSVTEVKKGEKGSPGELRSSPFDIDTKPIGRIYLNKGTGIYGVAENEYLNTLPQKALSPGFKETVKEEEAEILSTIDGETPQAYKVKILKVYKENTKDGKNMLIKITDERLLAKTGGIVQGMSGSPIIQNGKLIGAVTHVLVNDPTKGYGIFIENMLEEVFNEGKGTSLPLTFSFIIK